MQVLFFAHHGHLQELKVHDLKLLCLRMSGSLEFLWLTYDSSNNVMYCDICRKAGPDIAGKTKFVTGKKSLNVKVLFIIMKI
jgi:hypothetical protein